MSRSHFKDSFEALLKKKKNEKWIKFDFFNRFFFNLDI